MYVFIPTGAPLKGYETLPAFIGLKLIGIVDEMPGPVILHVSALAAFQPKLTVPPAVITFGVAENKTIVTCKVAEYGTEQFAVLAEPAQVHVQLSPSR